MSDLLLRATAAEERAESLEREMRRLRTALEKIRFTEGLPRGDTEGMMADLNELTELMNVFRNQTPSSPAWYQVIDRVVGTLLQLEINRAVDEQSYADLRASGGIANAP